LGYVKVILHEALDEFRETPNVKTRAILSQACDTSQEGAEIT